jgi:hypothetical protein
MKSLSHIRHLTLGILAVALLGGCDPVPSGGPPPPSADPPR